MFKSETTWEFTFPWELKEPRGWFYKKWYGTEPNGDIIIGKMVFGVSKEHRIWIEP
jgi:hypothetical protein